MRAAQKDESSELNLAGCWVLLLAEPLGVLMGLRMVCHWADHSELLLDVNSAEPTAPRVVALSAGWKAYQ
jgi:hypothetical protein